MRNDDYTFESRLIAGRCDCVNGEQGGVKRETKRQIAPASQGGKKNDGGATHRGSSTFIRSRTFVEPNPFSIRCTYVL